MRHCPDLIDMTFDERITDYSKDYYKKLTLVIADEFHSSGLKENDEPNEYGLRCEALIDEILHLLIGPDN